MDGYTDGWMDGYMDGWLDTCYSGTINIRGGRAMRRIDIGVLTVPRLRVQSTSSYTVGR